MAKQQAESPNPAGKAGKPSTATKASKGINPVQHSEGKAAPKASKGINPRQNSEGKTAPGTKGKPARKPSKGKK